MLFSLISTFRLPIFLLPFLALARLFGPAATCFAHFGPFLPTWAQRGPASCSHYTLSSLCRFYLPLSFGLLLLFSDGIPSCVYPLLQPFFLIPAIFFPYFFYLLLSSFYLPYSSSLLPHPPLIVIYSTVLVISVFFTIIVLPIHFIPILALFTLYFYPLLPSSSNSALSPFFCYFLFIFHPLLPIQSSFLHIFHF